MTKTIFNLCFYCVISSRCLFEKWFWVSQELEIQSVKEKIKQVTSPTLIKLLEVDIDKLEQDKLQANVTLSKKEEEQVDIQTEINLVEYYMEHLKELLLESDNPPSKLGYVWITF